MKEERKEDDGDTQKKKKKRELVNWGFDEGGRMKSRMAMKYYKQYGRLIIIKQIRGVPIAHGPIKLSLIIDGN